MKSFIEFLVGVVVVVALLPHAEVIASRLNVVETPISTAPAGVEVNLTNASKYIVYCEGQANGIASSIRMGWDLVTNQCRPHDVYDDIILSGKGVVLAINDGLKLLTSQ